MQEVTAEMIERGRDGSKTTEQRRLAQRVRAAREKLTSSGTGQRAFDVEMLRVFAERQRRAAPALSMFALVTAALASFWLTVTQAVVWLGLVCGAVIAVSAWVNAFLADADAASRHVTWRRRFVFGEAARGLAWALLALPLLEMHDPLAQSLVLLVLLAYAATATVAAASLPLAAYSGLVPVTIAVVWSTRPQTPDSLPIVVVACTGLLFCIVLARHLFVLALDTLGMQAEKDALIVELEQSKLNSDEARRRAEEASLAKSRFLATMSHELRTPLNAILGFSEVMKGELFGPHVNSTYRDYSNDIHSSGQHLLVLINEILDLSRVEAGRYELHEESMALAHVVDDCRHLLTLRATQRNIRLNVLVEPSLSRIWADERAMRQIVLNLLSNAIKFTPQGGSVTIKVGWTQNGGQYVSVRDTGPGIPEHEIPVIMSSFGRGSLAQKNAEEGSGLGLPIVKGLIELHGGTFTLRSKVREGTEVTMMLPPERAIDALPPVGAGEATAAKQRRRGPPMRPAAA